jgi:hypothetical protein
MYLHSNARPNYHTAMEDAVYNVYTRKNMRKWRHRCRPTYRRRARSTWRAEDDIVDTEAAQQQQ